MGVMAGNIIAAIPAVQLAAKTEIAIGLYVVIAAIISGWFIDNNQEMVDVAINPAIMAFWPRSISIVSSIDSFKILLIVYFRKKLLIKKETPN